MTDAQLLAIWKTNNVESDLTAIRAIFTTGYYVGKGTTVAATLPDQSKAAAQPAAIIKLTHQGQN